MRRGDRRQGRGVFFETGRFNGKYANSSTFNGFCGAAPAPMARAQAAAMLESFVSDRRNEFREAVQRSSLDSGGGVAVG
jgi:hypothetical protein